MASDPRLILWVGARHSGKTTAAANLVRLARREGFNVAGLLAPALYDGRRLTSFDVLDLHSGARELLARQKTGATESGPFNFIPRGQHLGRKALTGTAAKSADLVIVDEFGPVELAGGGWRKSVDWLLVSSQAVVLLVVRDELAEKVKLLYSKFASRILTAANYESLDNVVTLLAIRRRAIGAER